MRLLISILLLTALLPIISFGKRANPLIAMQGIWEIKSINTKGNAFSKLKSKTNQIEILPSQNSWRINIGCNQINAAVNSIGKDNIEFGKVISTKIACIGTAGMQENRIAEILHKANKYVAKANTITLLEGKKKLMVICKVGPIKKTEILLQQKAATKEDILGTYRIIHQLENGVITEHNLNTTTFKIGVEKGRYQANVGCNTISGAFEFTADNKIIFKDGMETKMSCGEKEKTETFFKQNLNKANRFVLAANHLLLFQDEMLLMMLEKK